MIVVILARARAYVCVCMQLCRIYKETLLRGRRHGASAPVGPRDENSPDAPKYFVVIVRNSSSTNAAGLKLFDRTLAMSGRHTQIALPTFDSMMHIRPREFTMHKYNIALIRTLYTTFACTNFILNYYTFSLIIIKDLTHIKF